ncbi:MAG TPA: hypothetical protein VMT15_09935 [Bryobacteraceae bacterium]|nr:hypothetical protein [Bryobacteraceae bacterium]
MKTNKALKRLAKIEVLLSGLMERYASGAAHVQAALRDARAALGQVKEAVSSQTSTGTAKRVNPEKAAAKKAKAKAPTAKTSKRKASIKKTAAKATTKKTTRKAAVKRPAPSVEAAPVPIQVEPEPFAEEQVPAATAD